MFKGYRKQAIDKLNTNGQVIYIEKILNDRFFLKNREIYITDISEQLLYIHLKREEQIPLYLHLHNENYEKVFIKGCDEGNTKGNFLVNIPSFLKEYEQEISNLVEYYKPAGRKFVLKIYEYE